VRQNGGVWHVSLSAPDVALAERAAAAIGTVCDTVSVFEATPGHSWSVEGIAAEEPDRAQLRAAFLAAWIGHGLPPEPAMQRLAARDWLGENQQSFPPRRIGRFFVHGSHYRGRIPAGARGLLIDAAIAFGTGEHASTAGCLRALADLMRRRPSRTVLDMGTGTGILAIAAAKLGARRVLAVDIDGNAVRVAQENFRRNGVGPYARAAWSPGYKSRFVRRRAPFDLVCANILAMPLAKMARDLGAVLAPGGVAILSGLLGRQEPLVLAAHRRRRLILRRRIAIDGWHTLILGRGPLSEGDTA
jgi:ribosomal protein L11 methyltransferase